jgi:galactitol-specific phosphotransferase system IIB component
MTLQEIHQLATQYGSMLKSKEITAGEYGDLMKGLDISSVIAHSEEELKFKEELNIYINAAIAATSMV